MVVSLPFIFRRVLWFSSGLRITERLGFDTCTFLLGTASKDITAYFYAIETRVKPVPIVLVAASIRNGVRIHRPAGCQGGQLALF
jgi:hypothetical protein